jgi:hypothetical protein
MLWAQALHLSLSTQTPNSSLIYYGRGRARRHCFLLHKKAYARRGVPMLPCLRQRGGRSPLQPLLQLAQAEVLHWDCSWQWRLVALQVELTE